MFALIGKFAGIPVIIRTIHNNFNPVWYRFPEYFLSRHFAKLLGVKMTSISDSVFENEKKLFVNKTIIIYNWFNHKRFYPITKEERKMTRSKLKISDQVIVLISTGSCLPQKRHKDIIFALKELVKKDYKVLYLHLGGGLLNNLEKELVNQLELKNEVRFLGNVNNVRDYLVASDFYIMPSEFEGLSIAAIEAMACKIPAILYNSPGLEELYRDDNLRKNLIKKSPSAITEKILELIENPSEINNIVENAYKMINLKFDMEKNVEQFIELYNNEK
jgi:glycosyltransferase involved in cell wall biosynthesis